MNCERARAAISERMDGERLSARVSVPLDTHLAGCPGCRTFEERASRVRTAVRIRPAEAIPDLVGPIMAEIARTAQGRRRRFARASSGGTSRAVPAAIAAALCVGLVAGSLVVGGPWQDRDGPATASAADVIRRVGVAARHVEAYHATYRIEEVGYSPEVPERSFEAELWFAAPGRYRLDVRDLTEYPSADWTPTDLRYVEAGAAVMMRRPSGCPTSLARAGCVPTRSVSTDRNRYPTRAPLAADLVVPLDVLANARGLTVVRTGSVLGRDAVLVRTTFERAAPMFPFFKLGGAWRPFFRHDRVEMWVDSDDWSPLRWTVYPADDPARAEWALLFGRDPEPPDLPIFDVTAVATDHDTPSPSRFKPAPADPPMDVTRLPADVGFRPVTPTATQGLALTDVAALDGGAAPPRSLLIYSSGLTYLRIIERRDSNGPGLFGAISENAERVAIGAGVGYYEPADEKQARRLAIRSADTSLFLETNLSREDLLAVAASLPLRGRA